MRRKLLLISILLPVLLILLACASPSTQKADVPVGASSKDNKFTLPIEQSPSWAQEWNNTIEGARKEGRLVIISTAGSTFRSSLIPIFSDELSVDSKLSLQKVNWRL